jgi:hypothetical protein
MATSVKSETARMNGKAIAARSEAVKKLTEKYPDEFGQLLREERVNRGLSPESGGESNRELLARLTKAREREAKILATLQARGVETPE